jgi:hypothetical protein
MVQPTEPKAGGDSLLDESMILFPCSSTLFMYGDGPAAAPPAPTKTQVVGAQNVGFPFFELESRTQQMAHTSAAAHGRLRCVMNVA